MRKQWGRGQEKEGRESTGYFVYLLLWLESTGSLIEQPPPQALCFSHRGEWELE